MLFFLLFFSASVQGSINGPCGTQEKSLLSDLEVKVIGLKMRILLKHFDSLLFHRALDEFSFFWN